MISPSHTYMLSICIYVKVCSHSLTLTFSLICLVGLDQRVCIFRAGISRLKGLRVMFQDEMSLTYEEQWTGVQKLQALLDLSKFSNEIVHCCDPTQFLFIVFLTLFIYVDVARFFSFKLIRQGCGKPRFQQVCGNAE